MPAAPVQMGLFDEDDRRRKRRDAIQKQFEEFDREHPEVYETLVNITDDLRRKGFRRYGVKSLFERVRWHFQIEKSLGEDWKLNNNYTSRYARKLIAEYPDLSEFFELRELKAQ